MGSARVRVIGCTRRFHARRNLLAGLLDRGAIGSDARRGWERGIYPCPSRRLTTIARHSRKAPDTVTDCSGILDAQFPPQPSSIKRGWGFPVRASPPLDAHGRRKLMREVAEAKKNCRNSERREKRAKEKLGEMEAKVEDMEMVVQATSDENELLHEQLDESTSRNSELKQRLKFDSLLTMAQSE